MENERGQLPFDRALERRHVDAARPLLLVSGLSASELLDALKLWENRARPLHRIYDGTAYTGPLCADLAAHQPLGADEWQRLPVPCPGLECALPAVLARSDAEAALLVAHLPPVEQACLREAALCLARAQRVHDVELPPHALRAILAHCVAG